MNRRFFLRRAIVALTGLPFLKPQLNWAADISDPLQLQALASKTYFDPELNLELPLGSSARIIARSGEQVAKTNFIWHKAPDGGACFTTNDGWVYVSNSEIDKRQGGVSAIRFEHTGAVHSAYSILTGTSRNCAGGKTLWQTWLSCEENGDDGQVYECDPYGKEKAKLLPAMGSFNHEAVAIDPVSGYCYMTEDVKDGCLYRFIPDKDQQLKSGRLEVAVNEGHRLIWQVINDPDGDNEPCRYQVPNAIRFKGGEGIIYNQGCVYFVTKKDNRVWRYHISTSYLDIVYDLKTSEKPILSGVDNIEVAPSGELIIAEDGGDMQLIGLDKDFQPFQLVRVLGQEKSELTGPAFSPDGRRLYFSSQRGETGKNSGGITYEVKFPNTFELF